MSDRYRDRDDEADLDLEEAEPPKRRGRLLAALIALFAVGGFGGVLWYAYSQGHRSADAVAPILKADGEPSRMKPDQPGGMVVPHQDKLVLNNMQQASRPGQVEKLLPPAESPLPQTARTAPPPSASVSIAPVPSAPAPAPTPPPAPIPPPATAIAPPPAPIVLPPASPPPAAPSTSASGLVAPPAPPPVAPAPSSSSTSSSSSSSSSSSPPPVSPPSMATPPQMAPPPQMAARPPAPSAAPPAPSRSGVAGEWRVQLGSFPAVEQANAQWDRLKKAHAELQPLGLTTVRVDLGEKGVWYRLQAGPLNEPGARSLCEDLKAKKRDCLVVRP